MNRFYRDFGYYIQTEDNKFYAINKVYIFKDGEIKIVTDYFLDDLGKNEFEFLGAVKKKNKIDLTEKTNFVIKSKNQNSWDSTIKQDLYINGDINNYEFYDLTLNDFSRKKKERLDIEYTINGYKCSHCVGWNNKESNKIKYEDIKKVYQELSSFSIDSDNYLENIKKLEDTYYRYKTAIELEESYIPMDYNRMNLASGTTEEENKMMIANNIKDYE